MHLCVLAGSFEEHVYKFQKHWDGQKKKPIKTNFSDNMGIFESGQSIQKREGRVKSSVALVHPICSEVEEEVCKWIRFR